MNIENFSLHEGRNIKAIKKDIFNIKLIDNKLDETLYKLSDDIDNILILNCKNAVLYHTNKYKDLSTHISILSENVCANPTMSNTNNYINEKFIYNNKNGEIKEDIIFNKNLIDNDKIEIINSTNFSNINYDKDQAKIVINYNSIFDKNITSAGFYFKIKELYSNKYEYTVSFKARLLDNKLEKKIKMYTGNKYIIFNNLLNNEWNEFKFQSLDFNFSSRSTYRINLIDPEPNLRYEILDFCIEIDKNSYNLETSEKIIKKYNNYDNSIIFNIDGNIINYLHFIESTLPLIKIYFDLKKYIKDLKVTLSCKSINNVPNFIKEFYNFYGLNDIDIHEDLNQNTIYKNILLFYYNEDKLYPPTWSNKYFYSIYDEITNKINLQKKKIQTYDYIYISRRYIKHNNIGMDNRISRKLINEDKLVTFLEKYNFKEIFLEEYNLVDKIHLLNSAKLIIHNYGAGIINHFFTKNNNIFLFYGPYGCTWYFENDRFYFKNIITKRCNNVKAFNFEVEMSCDEYDLYNKENKNIYNNGSADNRPWKINMNKVDELISNYFNT